MTLRVSCLWIRLYFSRCMILQAAFKTSQQKCFLCIYLFLCLFICAFLSCSVFLLYYYIVCFFVLCFFFQPLRQHNRKMFFIYFCAFYLCFFFFFLCFCFLFFYFIFSPSFIISSHLISASQTQYQHYCNGLVSNTSTSSVIVHDKINSINVFPS